MLAMMMLWGSAGAWAQSPEKPVVLFAGSPSRAVSRVVQDIDGDAKDLDARRLKDLLVNAEPYMVGGEAVMGCLGTPSTQAEILKQIALAEELLKLLEVGRAQSEIDAAARSWRCLSQPAESAVGARLNLVRGVIRYAAGDSAGARVAFSEALQYQPQLEWDTDFGEEPQPLFRQARQEREPIASFSTVPYDAPVSLRVDGQPVRIEGQPIKGDAQTIAIAPGDHVVQLVEADGTVQNFWRRVGAGEAIQLVIPEQLSDDRLARVDEVSVRADLTTIITASSLAERPAFYVPSRNSSWSFEPQVGQWEQRRQPWTKRNRQGLFLSGGASLVIGGGAMIFSSVLAANQREQIETDDRLNTNRYDQLVRPWPWLRAGYWGGAGLVGLGVVGTGLAVSGTF